MTRACITGGAGFVGTHLADALLARGDEVVLLDCLHPQVHPGGQPPSWLPTEAKFLRGDVRDPEAVSRAIRECEVVYHLAAETGTGQSMYEVSRYVEVNVVGMATVIEAIMREDSNQPGSPRRLVLASSRAVHGEGAARCPEHGLVWPGARSSENLAAGSWEPLCPECGVPVTSEPTAGGAAACAASVYGATKHAQEELTRLASAAGALDAWALRFQNVYGPRQSLSNPYTGLLGVFTGRALAGRPCEVYEDGGATRDLVHVGDVVEALVAAGDSEAGGYRCLSIGSGEKVTILDLARRITSLAGGEGAPAPEICGRFRAGDVRHAAADIDAAAELLDWRPQVSLEEGLAVFVNWVKKQPHFEDGSTAAHEELIRRGLGGEAAVDP